jgi:lysophospholipase L1-like esterase
MVLVFSLCEMRYGAIVRTRANILLAAGAVAVGLVVCEVVLQVFFPFFDPYESRRRVDYRAYIPQRHRPHFSYRARAEDGLPGMSGEIGFSTNRWGFRGDDVELVKPDKEKRVFLLGGSAMECALTDDQQAPHRQLQDILRKHAQQHARVLNAAHSGDTSFDHIAMLAHRVVHFDPDVVVVMSGLNDLRAAMLSKDYLHLDAHEPLDYGPPMLVKLAATELQLPRRIWALTRDDAMLRIGQDLFLRGAVTTNYRAAVEACRKLPAAQEPPRVALDFFERNLETLVGIARAHGAKPILLTQPATWTNPEAADWHWLTCAGGVRHDENALAAALEAYNQVTRTVAERHGVVLVDVARALPATLEHFYDDAHFTAKGVDALVAALTEPVLAQLE